MAGQKLDSKDIRQLLDSYESNVRRLQFEIEQAKSTVKSLKISLKEMLAAEKEAVASAVKKAKTKVTSAAPAKRRGRPRKSPEAVATPAAPAKRRGRPRKNPEAVAAPAAPAKRRGRPRKNPEAVVAPAAPAKRRGRPRKNPEAIVVAPIAPAKRRGRPRKNPEATTTASTKVESATTAPKKRGRKPGSTNKTKAVTANPVATPASLSKAKSEATTAKKTTTTGYRLSEYDMYVLEALEKTGKVMVNSDLISYVSTAKASKKEKVEEDQISLMISRSLQKLVNRKKMVAKAPFEGRGHAYALPAWMSGKRLKKEHKR